MQRTTPVPQDLLSRLAVEMFDENELIGVPTAGCAFFGNSGSNGSRTLYSPDSQVVDIDIIRGSETHAALVPRGMVTRSIGSLQKGVRNEQWSSFSRKYPLAIETASISAENLTDRLPGESTVNSGVTQFDRARYWAIRKHMENMRRIARLCEILAWQSLMTGTQDAILGTANADLKYDFLRHNDLFIQCGTSWAGGTAKILTDIDTACTRGRTLGHVRLDMMICGSTAMNSIINDATVQKLADNRRFGFISFANGAAMPAKYQRFIDGGMVFQGTLRTPQGYELFLFTYPEFYTDVNGTATAYLNAEKVLICDSSARADRYFGPAESLPMIPQRAQFYREMFGFDPKAPMAPANIKGGMDRCCPPQACFCNAYPTENWKSVMMETQCAPIFATTQTDGFVVLDTEP